MTARYAIAPSACTGACSNGPQPPSTNDTGLSSNAPAAADQRVSRPGDGSADEEHVADDPTRTEIGGRRGDDDEAGQRNDQPDSRSAARALAERGPGNERRHDRDQAGNEDRAVARRRVPHAVEEEEVVGEDDRETEREDERQIRTAWTPHAR